MSRLFEILGRAINIDTADLIWHWFNVSRFGNNQDESPRLEQLQKIFELISCEKTEQADELLKHYILENPACSFGRMIAAAICISDNQLDTAIEQLNSVYTRQPGNTMALYALGHCYERLSKEEQAIEFYQDCLKFKNYLELPRQRLAAIYFKNGQLEKTIREYELLQQEYPSDLSILVVLGYLYIAICEYDRSVDTFNKAILLHPDNFNGNDEDIDQLIYSGQLNEALDRTGQLLIDQPHRVDLILKQGDILRMLGSIDDSIEQYEQALTICPDFLEATIKLGTEYLQTNSEVKAARLFNKAVEINDCIVDAYIGLATAQKLSQKDGEAEVTLSLASAILPNSSLLFAETAKLQFKIRFEESYNCHDLAMSNDLIESVIAAHREELKIHPNNADVHYRLGTLMMSVSRISAAANSFKKAIDINPTFHRAKSKLAVCLFRLNKKYEALALLESPNCLDKKTLKLHYEVALLYCDRIKFASSLINLDRLMQDNFTSADPTINISIVLQNLGIIDRASTMWDNLGNTADFAVNNKNKYL